MKFLIRKEMNFIMYKQHSEYHKLHDIKSLTSYIIFIVKFSFFAPERSIIKTATMNGAMLKHKL